MDPIHIDFTIPDLSLFIGFGLLVFAIVLYLAISKHWEWLQNRPSPLPWLAEHYVAFLLPVGFVAIALAIYFWIWDIRGEIGQIITLLDGQTDPTNIRNLAYAIGALLAAVALSATIPFQLIKVWVNERLAKTTEQGHMTDRISKAVEQLGAEKTIWEGGIQKTVANLEVRLGAIYALERIAQDSIRDHIPVMEILCAYVRLNSPYSPRSAHFNNPSIDIQTIITVLGRRKPDRIKYEINASANSFNRRYTLDLSKTNLEGLHFSNLNFDRANFDDSNLNSSQIFRAKMSETSFRRCKMKSVELFGSSLYFSKFYRADLSDSSLTSVKASKADFSWSTLSDANLNNSILTGACLGNTNLRDATFIESDLRASVLIHADISSDTNFSSAKMELSLIHDTDLEFAAKLTQEQLSSMFGSETTIPPRGMTSPNWKNHSVDHSAFYKAWDSAKAAANL